MPKREDEYWAEMKEPKGRGLCPFCGSSNIYYNKRYKSWRCGGCEKTFPSPSYGSGYDRYMTPEETTRAAERAAERQRGTPARIYRGRDDIARGRKSRALPTLGGFTARRAFLIFLLIACILAAVYTSYLLFTHRTDPVIGTIIFVADIGVLIWNISVLRKWRVGTRTVVAIAVIIAVLGATTGAFAGIKPFSTAKNEIVTWFQKTPSQPSEQQPPPVSANPADISGHVTIAETVKAKYPDKPDTMEMIPLEGQIYWIVDISVKNNSYENEVATIPKGYRSDYPCYHWKIIVDDQVYDAQRPFLGIPAAYPMSVPMGETGETTIRFVVPDTLKISSAKLCYQGQEPYSYGKLTGGDKVAVYDWDLRKAVPKQEMYVIAEFAQEDKYLELITLENWEGSSSRIIQFDLDHAPAVINYASKPTSKIASSFRVSVITQVVDPQEIAELKAWQGWVTLMGARVWEENGKIYVAWSGFEAVQGPLAGVRSIQVMKPGNVVIDVDASGCDWWVKVGVEP
jgi:ribosomal protein L37AE/L43A